MREKMPTAPLAELANFTMGQSPDSAHVSDDERGLPFLQGCAEFGARHPSARVYCSPPLRIAKAGSTLISVRAPVGTMNRADQDFCIGRGLAAILAKAGVADDVFLTNAIEQNISYLHRRSQGSTFLAVGSADLKTMPVAAPDLPQQRRIAEILSTVDEAIEQTEALIAKTQQIKAGLMRDLFTRGVTADGRLRPPREEAPQLYKESPLGWIPKEWASSTLGGLSDVVRGSTPRPAKDPRFFDGDFVPWITVGELSREDWPFLTSTATRLTREGSERSRFLDAGTVVISNSGFGCGVPRILEISGCANDGVAALLSLKSTCAPLFLYFYLYTQTLNLRTRVARGNDQPNLNTDMLKAFPVPQPSFEEQTAISERLFVAISRIREEAASIEKLRVLKTGLMQDLLTGRVPVAVGTKPELGEVAANV